MKIMDTGLTLLSRNSFQRRTGIGMRRAALLAQKLIKIPQVAILGYNHNSLDEPALHALNLFTVVGE
jgi:ABC-type molybdenum transport system ATPase subunit/photorepair protein PhrA